MTPEIKKFIDKGTITGDVSPLIVKHWLRSPIYIFGSGEIYQQGHLLKKDKEVYQYAKLKLDKERAIVADKYRRKLGL